MGGKHKQAQRVKNNARPSSSGRSAELLGSSHNPFVGFQTVKDTTFMSNLSSLNFSSASSEDIDPNVDVKFQLVLKKMNKKDGTTKLKALQEFTELVKSSDPEAVKAILPFWPRIYTCLVVDVEHRVREGVHQAHHAVVTKVKRNLAPYLKQLSGPWFTSQYDTYPPAATAAQASFEIAFPPNKLQEAIAFCQEEILQYICDNICDQSAESLGQAKKLTAEEAEAKYERVLISSLQGYTLYLNKLSPEQLQNAKEINAKIISNKKFWKLVQVKIPMIRAAWFGCITALCQNAPFLLDKEPTSAIGAVFSNLNESEPTVLPSAWEAALLIVTNINEWYRYVNMEKLVLPKLWQVLREGGQGNATVIYPNLLPLLSKFPTDVNSSNFYSNFFSAMRQGLKKQSVIQSRAEFTAVITAYMECFRYIIKQNVSNIDECENLVQQHLIPPIDWTLINQNSMSKHLYNEVATLLHYWCRNIESEENNYPIYTKCFWDNIQIIFDKYIVEYKETNNRHELLQIIKKETELLLCLKRKNILKKKDCKVKFANDSKPEEERSVTTNTESNVNLYMNDLNKVTYEICYMYLKLINLERMNDVIPSLLSLVQEFDSQELFSYLNIKYCDNSTNLLKLYHKALETKIVEDDASLEPIIDVVFMLFKYLNDKEKEFLLFSLGEVTVNNCLFWTAKKVIHHPYCNDETVQHWLETEKVTNLLVSLTSSMLTNKITTDEILFLKQALSQNGTGDVLISQEGCSKIMLILCDALLSPSQYPETLERCASFAAQLSTIVYNEKTFLTYGDQLLLALFSLNCNNSFDKDIITTDTLYEVSTAWQDVLSLFTENNSDLQNIIWKFTKIIQNTFWNQNSFNDIDYLKYVIFDLIKTVISKNLDKKTEVFTFMLKSVLVLPEKLRCTIAQINELCLCAQLIENEISWVSFCPVSLDTFEQDVGNVELLRYMMWYQLVLSVLKEFFSKPEEDSDDDEEDNDYTLESTTDDINETITSSLYCYAAVVCFSRSYQNTKLYNEIGQLLPELKLNYIHFTDNILIPKNFYDDIFEKIYSNSGHPLWAKYFSVILNDLFNYTCNFKTIYNNLTKSKDIPEMYRLQLTKLFSSYLSFEMIPKVHNLEQILSITSATVNYEENDIQVAEALTHILSLKKKDETKLFYNRNISSATWAELQTVLGVMRLLKDLIENRYPHLNSNHWDFVIISLAAWANSVEKSIYNYTKTHIALFITTFCDLFCAFQKLIRSEKVNNFSNISFIGDYVNLFAQEVHIIMFNTWLHVAEKELTEEKGCLKKISLLEKVGNVVFVLNPKFIINTHLKVQNWKNTVLMSCKLLKSPEKTLQLWGYNLLTCISKKLVNVDNEFITHGCEHGELFPKMDDTLKTVQEVIQVMLLEFKLGEDTCRVEPYTDSYRFTFGYLLLWDVLLSFCKHANNELRFQYLEWLRKGEYVKDLLSNLFRLMPMDVLHCTENRRKIMTQYFTNKPTLLTSDIASSELLEHLVCWVYGGCLTHLPALVRQWWTDSDPRVAHTVEQVTTTFVSPQLITLELTDVLEKEKNSNHNMKIKVHFNSREVIAVYTVDEARMELIVTLPMNYPLGTVQVDGSKQIGGPSQWRNWVMQLTMFLTHQNGSIWDGLSLWKNNLDKKFDGVEECYICFSVLHAATYQLPKLVCQTCKKKFHSTCLYKWFSTSNKSTCPICRNLF